jgi:hypothetical protein
MINDLLIGAVFGAFLVIACFMLGTLAVKFHR